MLLHISFLLVQAVVLNIKRLSLTLSFVVLVLFASLRDPSVGTDYARYVAFFEMASDYSARFEPGFVTLVLLAKCLWDNVIFVTLVVHAFMYFFIYNGIAYFFKGKNSTLAILTLFMLGFMFTSFNGMRQAIAVSISLFSVRFIIERRSLLFSTCIALAISFHYSAIAFFPIYWICSKNKASIMLLLAYLAFVLTLPVLMDYYVFILPPYYRYILTYAPRHQGFYTSYILFSLTSLFCSLFLKHTVLIRISLLGLAYLVAMTHHFMLVRFYQFFGVFLVITAPLFVLKFKGIAKVVVTYIFFSFAGLYYVFMLLTNSNGVVPYHLGW